MVVNKIIQTRTMLAALGMPQPQQTDIAALTLLVLAGLSEQDSWAEATRHKLRVHDILVEIKAEYGRSYAENTRETIRRQVLHQFEQAGIVLRNADDPSLPTNSPKTYYALTEALLKVLQLYGTTAWDEEVAAFRQSSGSLRDLYLRERIQDRVPLVYMGETFLLSPGKHNSLQAAVLSEFAPRFAPGAALL